MKTENIYFFANHPMSLKLADESLKRIDGNRRATEPVTNQKTIDGQTNAITDWWFNTNNGYFDKLKEISQPVFIINGDRDAFFTVTASNIIYTSVRNGQIAIFPQAGHAPQHQHPKRVASMINQFLN